MLWTVRKLSAIKTKLKDFKSCYMKVSRAKSWLFHFFFHLNLIFLNGVQGISNVIRGCSFPNIVFSMLFVSYTGFEAMSARGLADHRLITPAAPVRATSHRRRGTRIPLWFHGLLCRGVAEDLLTKSPTKPKEGLFLVRQSSNRGGGYHVYSRPS